MQYLQKTRGEGCYGWRSNSDRIAFRRSPRRGQATHQLLLLFQESAKFRRRRVGLDAALHVGQLPLRLPMLKRLDAAHGLFPGWLVGLLEQNLEEQPPVALLQRRSH